MIDRKASLASDGATGEGSAVAVCVGALLRNTAQTRGPYKGGRMGGTHYPNGSICPQRTHYACGQLRLRKSGGGWSTACEGSGDGRTWWADETRPHRISALDKKTRHKEKDS